MRVRIGCLCVSLLSVTAAHAGVVVHMAQKSSSGDQAKERSVVYAQDGFLRIDDLDGEGHVQHLTLFLDGVIWRAEVAQRTFQKFDKNAMAVRQNGMQERMQAMMQNMPPEKRAMFEERMKAMQQHAVDYALSDTGRSEHAGSYPCEIWQLSRSGKLSTEYCVASKGSLPGGDELVNASHKAAAVAADVMSASPMIAKAMPPLYTLYGKMDGFPVLVRRMSGGKPSEETIVTAIERKSLPADKFAIPQGFTETQPGAAGADE